MGQGQSSSPEVSKEKSLPANNEAGGSNGDSDDSKSGSLTAPYDKLDKLQAQLPSLIDEESRQQVDDYMQACDNGKGPMVACFATAEYIGMFEMKVRETSMSLILYIFNTDNVSNFTSLYNESTKKLSNFLRTCVSGQKQTSLPMERKLTVQRQVEDF